MASRPGTVPAGMGEAANKAGKPAGKTATPSESSWSAFKRWTGIEDPEADARLDELAGDDDGASRWPHWLPVALLFALYGLAVLIYILLGHRQPLPQVAPDEYQYSALARSIADGNGLTYNGGSIGIRAALYIYAVSPAWLVTDSLTQSYAIAKALGAVMLCAVAFPTWLLARRYMPPLVALIPTALVLAGSWMSSAGQMLMENLAFPLAASSLAALVFALARPKSRWLWIAFGFALLATAARAQLAVLIPVILLAVLVDIGLQGHRWRERLRPHRWLIGLAAALTVIGGIVIMSDPSVLGAYAGLKSDTDLGRSVPLVGRQAIAFIAMSAVLPFVVALAISLRRRAWDESGLRPLLVVFWVSTLSLIVATGTLSTAFQGVDWSIQRYVEYRLPLLYVVVFAGIWRGLLSARLALGATTLIAGVLLATPGIQNIQEQRGVFGLVRRADQLFGASPGPTMALLALVLGAATLLAVRLIHGRSERAVLIAALVVLTGAVFAVQDQAGWQWQINQARVWRSGFPSDLSWIDHATRRPLARIVGVYNPYRTPQTEFFNRRIIRTYVPATPAGVPVPVGGTLVNGFVCTWSVRPTGTMRFDPRCGAAPTAYYLNDDLAKLTFYGQRVIAQKPDIGRITTVNVKPRLRAVVNPPCFAAIATQDPKTGEIHPPLAVCGPSTQGKLYLDSPATVVLRFAGGQSDQNVQVQTTWSVDQPIVALPAGRPTEVTLHSPAGRQAWQIAFDWQGAPPATPRLVSVVLEQGRTRTELLY